MTFDTVPQTVLFPDLFDKPLVAEFDRQQTSSDGGAVLLKAAERVYGMVKAFARCLVDKRASRSIWTRPTTRRTAPAARRRTPPFWSTGRMRAFSGWRWHLDEVFVKINRKHAAGSAHYGAVVVPAHVAVAGGAITIRNLDDDVKTRLRTRAARHGRPVDRPSNTAGAVRPGMRERMREGGEKRIGRPPRTGRVVVHARPLSAVDDATGAAPVTPRGRYAITCGPSVFFISRFPTPAR